MRSPLGPALATLSLLLAACGGEAAPDRPGTFELRGEFGPDPTGAHAFALDFGRVGVRGHAAIGLELHNGTARFWEAALRTEGTAFDAPMRLQLPPGATLPFSVFLRPRALGPATGVLTIELPDGPLRVALAGEVVEGCLDVPAQVSFEETAEGCFTEPARMHLRNGCDHPIRIQAIDLAAGDWFLRGAPILPATLEARGQEWVEVQFTPRAPGSIRTPLRFTTAEGEEATVQLRGEAIGRARSRHLVRQGMRPDADRLYVIDDSPAMAPMADALAAWIRAVEPDLEEIDLRVGVTTASRGATVGCEGSGAGGRLLPTSGVRRVLDRIDVLDGFLAERAALPFCSQAPNEILAAADHAVRLTTLVDDPDTEQPDDGNFGLRRPDVPLQVVLVSAADDASPGELTEWYARFRALQREADVRFLALLTAEDCAPIPENHRIGVLAETLRAPVLHLCDPPSGGPWATRAPDWPMLRRFPLPELLADLDFDGAVDGAVEGFVVRVEGVPVPQLLPDGTERWRVDPAEPAVEFAPGHEPDEDEIVEFEYLPACG